MPVEIIGLEESSFIIEPLRGHENWIPWKRRMFAILREMELDEFIEEGAGAPEPKERDAPTNDEKKTIAAWMKKDSKAQTRIVLAVGDTEMAHLFGATTAREMWKQLTVVYEPKGPHSVLAAWRAFFRMPTAAEDFDIRKHIGQLRMLKTQLHSMGMIVSDENFLMVLITSLPESWYMITSEYLRFKLNVTSHELVGILISEGDRRRGHQNESVAKTAIQASRSGNSRGNSSGNDGRRSEQDVECFNCHKRGHVSKDCWAEGGGKEGQGPKRRRRRDQQAREISVSLNDTAF